MYLIVTLLLSLLIHGTATEHLGPIALVSNDFDKELYVAHERARRVDIFDLEVNLLQSSILLSGEPSGLAYSKYQTLYVTLSHERKVAVVDLNHHTVTDTIAVQAGAVSPVLEERSNTLYVCNRFAASISVIDLSTRAVAATIPVNREPIVAKLSQDGIRLFVTHHLPEEGSTAPHVAANVSVINTLTRQLEQTIELPNGTSGVRDMALSIDGSTLFIPHVLARYTVHTSQLEQGWMNTNAVSLIDVNSQKLLNTIILDDVDQGAANPWGCAVNQTTLAITHAGTHELSLIDLSSLMNKLDKNRAHANEIKNRLGFLYGMRQRVRIPGNGPRAITAANTHFIVGNFFSDSLSLIAPQVSVPKVIELNSGSQPSDRLLGEQFFNDATLCFQNWQSCASCHPDARVDGLNWDLLNDGVGNPKNAKSMLFSHQTPPAMWTGARKNAEAAVRAGFKHIQFLQLDEQMAEKIDTYLSNLEQVPSPYLIEDSLSPAARRGEALFFSQKVGCSQCHPKPLFTDMKMHTVGTHAKNDFTPGPEGRTVKQTHFDTPSLIEAWRTGPYLHDGRYTTIREVITKGNHGDLRGETSHLTDHELDDLVEYILSL